MNTFLPFLLVPRSSCFIVSIHWIGSDSLIDYSYLINFFFYPGSPVGARSYALLCILLRCMILYSILLLYS